jgi:hypothetical protein
VAGAELPRHDVEEAGCRDEEVAVSRTVVPQHGGGGYWSAEREEENSGCSPDRRGPAPRLSPARATGHTATRGGGQ